MLFILYDILHQYMLPWFLFYTDERFQSPLTDR